jgi:hypothetical protein
MIRILLAAAIAAGAVALQPHRAEASGAPWCSVYSVGLGDTIWDCSYPSLEACVPYAIAGNRGVCNENPRYVGPPPKVHRAHRKHRVIPR